MKPVNPRMIDMAGKQYGRWTVMAFDQRKSKASYWFCKCSCGTEKSINGQSLRRGLSRSCGCLNDEVRPTNNLTHGHTRNHEATPEYNCWLHIKSRCYRETNKCFHRYGGRGITVCDRWLESFENFLADMGERPSDGHSIDRIDPDGNYEPSNCRWATYQEQNRNRRSNRMISLNGEEVPLVEACERLNVDYHLVRDRVLRGWSFDRAIAEPKHWRGKAAWR